MLACLVGASALGYTAQQGQQGQMKEEVFDATTCKGISGTDHDNEWCVANCGKDMKPINSINNRTSSSTFEDQHHKKTMLATLPTRHKMEPSRRQDGHHVPTHRP